MKKALITGITGQDGLYLAEFLLEKGYDVHGLVRENSSKVESLDFLCNDPVLKQRLFLHIGDLGDASGLEKIVERVQPTEIYNLASKSHINDFVSMPEHTAEITAIGTLRLLEAIRLHCPSARFFQAGSSELFGNAKETPQTEKTPFSPRSLYGIAKLYAFWTVAHYRTNHQLFACNGILFNHESPRRDESFVSQKIIRSIARINAGYQERLILGNLDAARDWGYAKDFVDGIWRVLQQDSAEDFILSTGRTSSVRKFVELAFLEIGIKLVWEGVGIEEKGIDSLTRKIVVEVSQEYFRCKEDNILVGDPSKAQQKLDWSSKTSLEELVAIMMSSAKISDSLKNSSPRKSEKSILFG
jgi:GDPmannose 4,6-dehydratase